MIDLTHAFSGMNVADEGRVTWTPPRSLPYFDGHFPENPIFPAVGIVDASMHALAKILGRNVEVETIASAKFTHVLGPDALVEIAFERADAHTWVIDWTIVEGKLPAASLKMRLRADA